MKILVDKYVPYLRGVLEQYADVEYLEPADFSAGKVARADALIIRTRTRCDAHLLEGSSVRLILTATIGFDHIDTRYCREHGIEWHNCPGCNAQGVCDWVESVLESHLAGNTSCTLGIVGVGHVGSLVAEMAERRGYRVLLNDPFRQDIAQTPLAEMARQANVITFHTPLTKSGQHPTWHLAGEAFFRNCQPGTLILNAARGGVVDEEALLRSGLPCAIDCWEGEPSVNRTLLAHALFGTYHIAGYTRMGKYNASNTCLQHLLRWLGHSPQPLPDKPTPAPQVWDIEAVSRELKLHPEQFETLREQYKLR